MLPDLVPPSLDDLDPRGNGEVAVELLLRQRPETTAAFAAFFRDVCGL